MSGLPVANVIPLEGGALVSGIVLTLTMTALYEHGFSFDIFNDKGRQKLVTFICLIGGIAGATFYGFNQTKMSFMVTNISVFILFLCGQYGLVIINHNTVIRLVNSFPVFSRLNIQTVQRCCAPLYLLPWAALIPIYLAFLDTYDKEVPLTVSPWNTKVSKMIFMVLIFTTEIFATFTDILLLKTVTRITGHHNTKATRKNTDMLATYGTVWLFMFCDFMLKMLVMNGYPFLFDGITTVTVVALRARANLYYGVMLKKVIESSKSEGTSDLVQSTMGGTRMKMQSMSVF
ncbi:hypothetical protein HDV01_005543 [Terramyces sp. JEL0728]|nr:hypothetical protein HDV01_005543 [Terramyces sp. JEL0728]